MKILYLISAIVLLIISYNDWKEIEREINEK